MDLRESSRAKSVKTALSLTAALRPRRLNRLVAGMLALATVMLPAAPRRLVARALADEMFTAETRHETQECGRGGMNVGQHQSAAMCAIAAGKAGCSTFMHSSAYPSWGCRCCADPEGGNDHNLWAVYDVIDCNDEGVECTGPGEVLEAGLQAAAAFCTTSDPDATAAANFDTAKAFHEVLVARDVWGEYVESFSTDLSNAAVAAAATLKLYSEADGGCNAPTACNGAKILLWQLRGLLLLADGDGQRAFPDSPERQTLMDTHRIALADAGGFNAVSVVAIHALFDGLPPHLMGPGVLYDAPFATMTQKDYWKCNGDDTATKLLHFTRRGFNTCAAPPGPAAAARATSPP